MKKKNPLTLWDFPYRKTYYLTHPHKWFHDLYWNIRNFWHRGRYGYAYVDVWNFCDWYPRVAAEALRYLAKHGWGYPSIDPWQTPKLWEDYLERLANELQRCADSQDTCFGEDRNEYKKEYDKLFHGLTRHKKDNEDGSVSTWIDETEEYKEIRDKYFARQQEIMKADDEYRISVYKQLGEVLPRIWD